ncbi:MAG: ATP synthase F1 subunit epsilon [Candidatus Kapaibacteriota bacterium]|jgi:F-type H+-transporting ATPase subunit epsilon
MEKLLYVEVVTPQKPVFKGNAQAVRVPGELSPFQILYNHAPIVSNLEPGIVAINDGNNNLFFAVSKGFVTVQQNKVSIFVEKAFTKDEIDKVDLESKLKILNNQLKEAKSEKEKNEISFKISEIKAQLEVLKQS